MEILNQKIINFNLLRQKAEIEILDNLYEQNIDFVDIKLSSKHYKTLFMNYYIKEILFYCINSVSKPFFIITKPQPSEFYEYFDGDSYQRTFKTNISKITSILPIIHHTDISITYDEFLETKENEFHEWVSSQIILQRDRLSKRSYKSIRKTLDYYNLNYLNDKIFQELKYKLIF